MLSTRDLESKRCSVVQVVNMALSLLLIVVSLLNSLDAKCGLCHRNQYVTDCSGIGLYRMWPIPASCSLRTVRLNLNYNHLTQIPELSRYEWARLNIVYLRGNPLKCDDICEWTKYTISSDCNCGEYQNV